MAATGARPPGMSLRDKENSPFTPGDPVPVELFVGRSAQIEELRRYAKQACSGRLENVFLSGDRGTGKSSLAHFLRELLLKERNMLGIHVFLGGVSTLEELVRRVFEELLKETHTENWFEKIRGLFGNFIKDVGLFGVSVGFSPPKDQLEGLVGQFPAAVKNLFEGIKDQRKGLFIILDDLNGLVDRPEFANWYKSFVDYVATQQWRLPALFMLCGLPERRDALSSLQPSLMRIFRVAEIEKLEDDEVRQFFAEAFRRANMEVTPDAMKTMLFYSTGLPTLMQEIGDAAYWVDTDGTVDELDAGRGVEVAVEKVGQKYLDPRVYRAIRSERYHGILQKLISDPVSLVFDKREVETRLSDDEKKVFPNFLRKMTELGVIESDKERVRGAYRFANRIFPMHIFLRGMGHLHGHGVRKR
jgi:hypothetical protein